MEFKEVIRKREAVRKFKDKAIEPEVLNQILEAGRLAPTGANKQPQRIYVLESKEALAKMDEMTPCRYGAPIALIVAADKSEAWEWEGYNGYEADAAIVATHILLAATDAGVGSIWAGIVHQEDVRDHFDLPESVLPVAFIPLGVYCRRLYRKPGPCQKKTIG